MKATAALSFALAGSAAAAGAADTVNSVLTDISSALKSFDTAIKGYNGGDATALTNAAGKIGQLTTDGASKISSGADLTLNDAVSITTTVNGLQGSLDTTLQSLEGIGPKLASAGQCGTIKSQLSSQATAAKALQDAIANKAPVETKAIAQQLGGKIGASITATAGKFDTICAGASSSAPPPSGGASSGGHSGHDMGAAPAAPAAPSSGSTAPKSGTATAPKSGASSTVPKPAQYTGSAATLNAGRALGLGAIAAFFAL